LAELISGQYRGPMPKDAEVLQQMADGLQYIHSRNLSHGDVKPNNFLISAPTDSIPLIKISDFGQIGRTAAGSRSLDESSEALNYLAPELLGINGTENTKASDVFSLGCAFFEFLTRGTHPFGGNHENILNGLSDLSSN
jgi:serine/threonine protein kinase